MRKTDIHRLEAFEMWIWRRMTKISWTEMKSNQGVTYSHQQAYKNAELEFLVSTVSKKRTNFETVQLKIIMIDFDDIWQKYSKYSRIEFVCFSFHVGQVCFVRQSKGKRTVPTVDLEAIQFQEKYQKEQVRMHGGLGTDE